MFKILSVLLFALYFIQPIEINACNVYKTDDDDDEGARRKRQIFRNARNIRDTMVLRKYFTECLNTLEPQAAIDWRTNVDYSVLDTAWFEDNAMVNCGFGFGKTDCWKGNLVFLIRDDASIRKSVDTCIGYYAQDFLRDPPDESRFSLSDRRKKRQIASVNSNNFSIERYSGCLTDSSVGMTDLRLPINYLSLSDFAEKYLANRSCFSGFVNFFSQPGLVGWPQTIVTFTRLDSPLRDSLQACGERIFPQEFPIPFNGLPQDDVIGSWGEWGNWLSCSQTCGQGTRRRSRTCFIVNRNNAISEPTLCDCEEVEGDCTTQIETCNLTPCSIPSWSSWVTLNTCLRPCSRGVTMSIRNCLNSIGQELSLSQCQGIHTRIRSCSLPPCPPIRYTNTWSSWTFCPFQCRPNRGYQTRKRCENGQISCIAPQVQRRDCSRRTFCLQRFIN